MQFIKLTIKRAFWAICLGLALTSFPQASFAVTAENVPNPQEQYIRGWVTDMANLFDLDTKLRLNQIISKFERKSGTEMAVVTVPDITPSATSKEFATQLFNYWGIGKKGINNGVLLLIVKNEHRIEIETGRGIEKILSNSEVANIISKEIIPYFQKDDFSGGTITGIQSLIMALEDHGILTINSQYQPNLQDWIVVLSALVTILVVAIWAIDEVFKVKNSNEDHQSRRRNTSSIDNGSSGDSGGFGGGDGGGGFGGGDSCGGGDGGGW
jgi:uncharacterized protein